MASKTARGRDDDDDDDASLAPLAPTSTPSPPMSGVVPSVGTLRSNKWLNLGIPTDQTKRPLSLLLITFTVAGADALSDARMHARPSSSELT
ncbi:hypothetical protein CGMCC3_g8127 [Colletotrichum fructicola]|nr:uncharacterized protein CGMCC3_g8127 [Colletotrichum fructicola]KAE9575853.1 hypothetical protein CGMCC3_g8127 [Colletotrichum fructicola]